MGRNNQGRNPTTLGRSLVKAKGDKRRQHQQRIASGGHDKHTTDLEENRGLQSTLDQSALDEFLNDAIMKEKVGCPCGLVRNSLRRSSSW